MSIYMHVCIRVYHVNIKKVIMASVISHIRSARYDVQNVYMYIAYMYIKTYTIHSKTVSRKRCVVEHLTSSASLFTSGM